MSAVSSPQIHKPRDGRALNLNLRFFAWPGLALLLIAGPLLRGLFFEPDLLPAQILMASVFLLTAWQEALERRPLLGRHPLDWAVLALVVAYLLSYLVAVDRHAALGEILKYGTYFCAYYVASRLVAAARGGARAPERAAAALARTLGVSATVVAALGVLAAAGVVDFPGAFEGARIMSTLQYPNALGGFLVLAGLLVLALLSLGGRALGQALGGVALFVFMAALIGTYSRGAWLAGLAGLAILLAALPPGPRRRALYIQGVAFGLAGLAMRFVVPGMGTPGYHGVKALAAGMLLAAVLVPAYDGAARRLTAVPLGSQARRLAPWLAAAYIGAVALFYFSYLATALPTPASQILPDSVVYRARAIDAGQPSLVDRKEFMRDALRIWRDHPLLGAGGGAWNALYHQYQRSLYWTTEVHSGPLQVAVETGLPGTVAFLATWWWFWRSVWRLRRSGGGPDSLPGSVLPLGFGGAALALGLHSVGDFDLSIPALAMTLWVLFGAVAGLDLSAPARVRAPLVPAANRGGPGRWRPLAEAILPLAAALALVLPSAGRWQAGRIGAEGARFMAAGELRAAAEKLEHAARLDPLRASYRVDLGQIFSVAGITLGRMDYLEKGERETLAAVALQSHDIPVVARAVEVFTLQAKPDLAVEQAERLAALLPLATFPYERLGIAYVAAARGQLRYGERDRAEAYIQKAADLPARVERVRTAAGGGWRSESGGPRVTPLIRLAAAQALYLRGEDGAAISALRPLAGDGGVGATASLWLAAAERRRGGKPPRVAPELGPVLDELTRLPRLFDIH